MANSYKGKIEYIEPIQSIQRPGKEPFKKRRVMIDATPVDAYTHQRGYEKHIIFEFIGKNVDVPNDFKEGNVVELFFDVESYQGTKKDGTQDWFTSVRGYKIELLAECVPEQANQQMQAQNVPPTPPMGANAPFPPNTASSRNSNAPF